MSPENGQRQSASPLFLCYLVASMPPVVMARLPAALMLTSGYWIDVGEQGFALPISECDGSQDY